MNCIIVDDEPLAREEMQLMLSESSDFVVTGLFPNAISAMEFLKKNQVDLVFLDIHMPKVTGLEFAAQVPKDTLVVFTTAYAQYALKSYELEALDYLLKPIDSEKLARTIEKARVYKRLLSNVREENGFQESSDSSLIIKSDRRFYKIEFDTIRFIEGLKDYVVIYTNNDKLITAMNLKTIHQKIVDPSFMRVGKSYIVNMKHVHSFDNHTIYIDESEIPLGTIYRNDFFNKYLGKSYE